MTHTVKRGENLLRIASAHGISLEQLLDANPRFKAAPDRLNVGDVLTIPDSSASPTVRPQARPATPPIRTGRVMGKLSEKFETSGRGPGTVSTGQGDSGGVSYGSYQMTSKGGRGTVGQFVSQSDFPFRENFRGLVPGGAAFTRAWKNLAATRRDQFQESQHAFIKKNFFDKLAKKIKDQDGLDVTTRSHALQDVIWSTAVQHGPGATIVHTALARVGISPRDQNFDRDLIVAIYDERGRKNARGELVHFSKNAPAVQRGVARRFVQEKQDALNMLRDELGG